MDARELRIGNLVECTEIGDTYTDRVPYYGKCIFPVFSACTEFVKLNLGFGALQKVKAHEVNPILLTDEWLIKFGLEQGGYDFLFWTKETKNGIFTICGDSEIEFGIRYNNEIELQLKYVHQLQNLYFALTGEELAITKLIHPGDFY